MVFSPVILVTFLEDSRTGKRKRLTVRTICRNLGRKKRLSGRRVLPPVQKLLYLFRRTCRPHPVSSTSPAARGRQQSLPLWTSFITASIFRETSAL